MYELVLKSTHELATQKYSPELRRKLDLLFYVNLLNTYAFIESPFPDVTVLSALGWKSVSFVKGYRSCVFAAANEAPKFIRDAVGRVVHRDTEDEAASNL